MVSRNVIWRLLLVYILFQDFFFLFMVLIRPGPLFSVDSKNLFDLYAYFVELQF